VQIGESLKVYNIYNYMPKNIDMTPCKCIFDKDNYLHYSHIIIKQIIYIVGSVSINVTSWVM
jgi:hypothetical protein